MTQLKVYLTLKIHHVQNIHNQRLMEKCKTDVHLEAKLNMKLYCSKMKKSIL